MTAKLCNRMWTSINLILNDVAFSSAKKKKHKKNSNMVKMVEHQYCIVIWKIRKMNRVRSDMDSQHDNVTIVNTEHNNWQQKVNLVFRLWHTQTCSIVLGEISKTSTPFNIDWLWRVVGDNPDTSNIGYKTQTKQNITQKGQSRMDNQRHKQHWVQDTNKTKHNTEGTIKNG